MANDGNRGKGFSGLFRGRKPKEAPPLLDMMAQPAPEEPASPPPAAPVPPVSEAEAAQERRDDQAVHDIRTRVARNTSGKEKPDLAALWLAYHKRNPQVWVAFEKYTLEAITAGHLKHFGFQMVVERLRWQTAVTGDDAYKLNNNHGPFYARLFAHKHPAHAEVFRTRLSAADSVDFAALDT